jgi:hypothetical protein
LSHIQTFFSGSKTELLSDKSLADQHSLSYWAQFPYDNHPTVTILPSLSINSRESIQWDSSECKVYESSFRMSEVWLSPHEITGTELNNFFTFTAEKYVKDVSIKLINIHMETYLLVLFLTVGLCGAFRVLSRDSFDLG